MIYQFTEGSITSKPNYRVEIQLNGLTVPTFQFRPDASLVIEADIAPMLRSALEMSFTAADRYVSTYVKYQAVWDGGSDSQVLLSGDVIFAYIGVEHDLNKRTVYHVGASNNGPLLNHGTTINCWASRTAYVEFLSGNDMAATCQVFYNHGVTSTSLGTFTGTSNGFQSFTFTPVADGTITIVNQASPSTVYRTFTVNVLPECTNPIYLKWINDYGGISSWLFSYNQVYNLNPQMLWRDKTITVEATGLTFTQWSMLQELNKDGIEYGDNQKSGVLCVDFTDEAYPVNVFPVEQVSDTMTKYARHTFSLEFRYSQLPNIFL